MEYKDPGKHIPILYLLYSWVPGLGFPVESLYSFQALSTKPNTTGPVFDSDMRRGSPSIHRHLGLAQ